MWNLVLAHYFQMSHYHAKESDEFCVISHIIVENPLFVKGNLELKPAQSAEI